ncbi:MAG: bifunctional hydroxymethylpyrimidine kinase/phosphomethylpyrimidine kinase, partial [Thermofilum sp.]|nr:bifunctional hydroxymethylpyrimidine kinase/phosphomethylpyrimidine kinase [Thermofilum sp.]
MTIAGSDSGGGAGIQADLKTFAALGVHGTVALTAVTAQNTFSVTAIQEISLDVIEKQIDAVY